MNEYYPHERQKTFYSGVEYVEQPFQRATNASAKYFRTNFMLICYAYLIIFAVSALEWLSMAFGLGAYGYRSQYASMGNIMAVMAITLSFSFSHYYIYLIYAHGYKSTEAQFYVDKYSSLAECKNSMKLMRNFYYFSAFSSVFTLALNWLTAKSSFAEQMLGLKHFLQYSYINAGLSEYGMGLALEYSKILVAYSWLVSAVCLGILFISILGIIQTHIAKVK